MSWPVCPKCNLEMNRLYGYTFVCYKCVNADETYPTTVDKSMCDNFIEKYFDGTVEYPRDQCLDILPWGVFWSYVSTTFLNAFINHVEIKKAFVLSRYHSWGDELNGSISIMHPPNSSNWVDFHGTKEERYNMLIEQGRVFHSKLDVDFQDDVLILSKVGYDSSNNFYALFWFDRDSSDSGIGRFKVDIKTPETDTLKDFEAWVMHRTSEQVDEQAKEIPIYYFQGWLSG